MKDGPKNRLRAQDIHKVVDAFTKPLEIPKFSRMVSVEEIERNDFNLNLSRYIDSQVPEDLHDIEGHLKGGIPAADVEALQRYWAVCPLLKTALFTPNRPGYSDLDVGETAIKSTIYEHPQFAAFIADMNAHFAVWRNKNSKILKALKSDCHPKETIVRLSEDLLAHYRGKPLIDPYDIYQHLMDYWAQTMQDDCYLIASDGWKAETYRISRLTRRAKRRTRAGPATSSPNLLSSLATTGRRKPPLTSSPPSWKRSQPNSPTWNKNTAARTALSQNLTR
jgi:type I restriction enzyme M protein